VSTEPNWALVFSESVFDIGPKQLHVAIETAVDSTDIASDCPGFGIGGDILKLGRFGSTRYDHAIVFGAEHIGFGTGLLNKIALVDARFIDHFRD
jgi:hypothetical protein